MKRYIVFSLFFLILIGCASTKKSNVQFVPIQISWEPVNELDLESKEVSKCMVHLTNSLMEQPEIQKNASNSVFSFVATVAETKVDSSNSAFYSFEGHCGAESQVNSESLCSWKAKCSPENPSSIEITFQK